MITDYPILLASQSPRRKYLLEEAGFQVEVISSSAEEIIPEDMGPMDVARYLAEVKMSGVSRELTADEIVLTADTIVIYQNEILGKPASIEEAAEFIRRLSDDEHHVVTGVCIKSAEKRQSFQNITAVTFYPITEEEIKYYLDHSEVLDKAGSYGVQDWIGWTKVKSITGSYSNIMGLPMAQTYHALQTLLKI